MPENPAKGNLWNRDASGGHVLAPVDGQGSNDRTSEGTVKGVGRES